MPYHGAASTDRPPRATARPMTDTSPKAPGLPLSPDALADRIAIQDLLAAYALGVDRRDYALLGDLFTEDGILATHAGSVSNEPRYEIVGRARIQRAMKTVERYRATTHLLGLPSVQLGSAEAQCETHCLARHLYEKDDEDRIYLMSIRYRDQCVKGPDGRWRFAERRLQVDWEEDRPFHKIAALDELASS